MSPQACLRGAHLIPGASLTHSLTHSLCFLAAIKRAAPLPLAAATMCYLSTILKMGPASDPGPNKALLLLNGFSGILSQLTNPKCKL
jgi:hypothetical protein